MSHTESDTQLVIHNNARTETEIETTANGAPTVEGLAEIFEAAEIGPPRAVLRRAQYNLADDARDGGPDLSDQKYIHGYDPVDDMSELRQKAMAAGRMLPPHPDDDVDPEETEEFEQYRESAIALVGLADLTAKLAPVSPAWDEPLDLGCSPPGGENLSCFHHGACGHDLEHRADLRELDPDTWEYRAKLLPRAANALQAVWWSVGLRADPRREIASAKRRVEDAQDRIAAELDEDHDK